jgi:hypothetical protein
MEVPIRYVNVFGFKAEGVKLEGLQGASLKDIEDATTSVQGKVHNADMYPTAQNDPRMAHLALRTHLERLGMQFTPDASKAMHQRKDPQAPLVLQVTRTLEHPADTPRYAQIDVTIRAGAVVLPLSAGTAATRDRRNSSSGASPLETSNSFSVLDSADMMDDDDSGTAGRAAASGEPLKQVFVWPARDLTIRLQPDPSPQGKIVMVLGEADFVSTRTDAHTQHRLEACTGATTNMKTALARDAIVQGLSALPQPVREEIAVANGLRGSPLMYLRGTQGEMIKAFLREGQLIKFDVLGYEGVQFQFSPVYDVETAVRESKAQMEERMQVRRQQDAATEGRKVKMFASPGVFGIGTTVADVKQHTMEGMKAVTQRCGGQASLWPESAIVTMEAGKDKDNNRVFFIVVESKATAEWLVAATKVGGGARLKVGGVAVSAHICRPRKEKAPHTHTVKPRGTRQAAQSPRTRPTGRTVLEKPDGHGWQQQGAPRRLQQETAGAPAAASSSAAVGRTSLASRQAGATDGHAAAAAAQTEQANAEETTETLLRQVLDENEMLKQKIARMEEERGRPQQQQQQQQDRAKKSSKGGTGGSSGSRTHAQRAAGSPPSAQGEGDEMKALLKSVLEEVKSLKETSDTRFNTLSVAADKVNARLNRLEDMKGDLAGLESRLRTDVTQLESRMRAEAQGTTTRLEEQIQRLAVLKTGSAPPQPTNKRGPPGSPPKGTSGEAKHRRTQDETVTVEDSSSEGNDDPMATSLPHSQGEGGNH